MEGPGRVRLESCIEPTLSRCLSEDKHSIQLIPISDPSNGDSISQYSSHNLQEEIISPTQFRDVENMSQFTKNHFDNPFVFCKQKSIPNFEPQYRSNLVKIENYLNKSIG